MKYHNTEKINVLYKKVPIEITRDEIEIVNDIKRNQNKAFESSHKFQIGDIVKV